MTELILNTGEFISESESVHDVILNRLDLLHTNNGKTYKYDPEEIRKALPLFNETPLVFANVHPENIGKISMEDALKEVDGRIVGTPQDVFVNDVGTLFRGKVRVTDPEVDDLIKKGKALLSTAFSATPDENGVLRNIIPNHILVYPLDTQILPGDHAALFLNQQSKNELDDKIMTDEKNDQLDLMRELVTNQAAKDELQAKISEQSELIFNQKTQLDEKDRTIAQKDELIAAKETLVANQATEIESLKGKLTELAQSVEENRLSQKRARRDRIFNQFLPGTQTAFEARKEELYDDEKSDEFIAEMFAHQAGIKQPPTEESGSVDVTNQGKLNEDEEARKAWEASDVRL